MKISLKIENSVEQAASRYFEKAKKDRSRLEGAREALEASRKKVSKLRAPEDKPAAAAARKPDWYEKFRWFYTSDGLLVIGGRDATTNEIIMKKYTEKDDIVFHTDMAGSPFFVIKADSKKVGKQSMHEAACATASYSRAWKSGLATTEVFYVKPEQVTKQPLPGEFLPRGAFMIRGKTNYIDNELRLAIGFDGIRSIGGPVDAIRAQCKEYAVIEQGTRKASDIAKEIKKRLGGELDEIIRFLPSGGSKVAAWKKG